MKRLLLPLLCSLFITAMFLGGCSSDQMNPVLPSGQDMDSLSFLPDADESQTNRNLYGTWRFEFDLNMLSASVIPDRTLNASYNVTQLVPPPGIKVNSFNPVTNVIDVDVTITNPSPAQAYDVRLIIYTDSANHRLLNPDNWTTLWDIPGGEIANPFRAYAKYEKNRVFSSYAQHTENLQIHLPKMNPYVSFAIDASIPTNCLTPFSITNFSQEVIFSVADSVGTLEVDVLDWQNDVSEVLLYCPQITGVTFNPFYQDIETTWKLDLENATGASPGEYIGYLLAKSYNSGTAFLMDVISIAVTPGGTPSDSEIINTLNTLWNCRDIAVSGNYAFIADEITGLKILDITDPVNPQILSHITIIENGVNRVFDTVAVNGDYIYVSGSTSSLGIAYVHDPYNPLWLDFMSLGHDIKDMAFSDSMGFMVVNDDLKVLDMTSQANPVLLASIDFNLELNAVEVTDDYLYFAGESFFFIYDYTDPYTPHEVNLMEIGEAQDLAISGNYAYLADSEWGFVVIDISNPDHIRLESQLTLSGPTGISVNGNHAYLTVGQNGLVVIDISNPGQPQIRDEISTYDARSVLINGDYAYVMDAEAGMSVIDVSNPADISIINTVGRFAPTDVVIEGDYAYLLMHDEEMSLPGSNGFAILDAHNRSNPVLKGYLDMPTPTDVAIKSNFAFVTIGENGLCAVDTSNPANPSLISLLDNFDAQAITVRGNYAYVAALDDGLNIIDISNPYDMQVVGNMPVTDACSIAVRSFYAYVGSKQGGLRVIDIGLPSNPVLIGYMTSAYFSNIVVDGNYAYAVAQDEGMQVIDLTDPSDPEFVSQVLVDGANDITTSVDYAYLAYEDPINLDCLHIIDVCDPYHPQIIDTVHTNAPSMGIAIIENYAYLAEFRGGLTIIQLW